MELPSNTILQNGKYKIVEKIGQGGFGIAYKANQVSLNRIVCIKEFFFNDLCERARNTFDMTIISASHDKIKLVDTFKKKFIKEARRLAEFQQPNIVQVTDVFEENNTAYFVMEYIDGESLEDLIRRGGALSEQKAKDIIFPIIDAMEAVHAKGLLHLDIKPANIMLRKNQTPVLIDFGISKYMDSGIGNNNTTTTAPIGYSEGYSPIEQSSFGSSVADLTKATDIYSLCATIYKVVTGVTPPVPMQILSIGLKQPRDFNSQLSTDFNDLIVKGLAIKPTDRHQNISDIRFDIKRTFNQTKIQISESEKYDLASPYEDGYALVKANSKYGYINKSKNLITQIKYEFAELFVEDLGRARLKRKYGFIDKSGNEVIQFKYDFAEHFMNGFAVIEKNKKWGFIDKLGNEITQIKYDLARNFGDGLAEVKLNGKWGYINKYGKQVTPIKYEIASRCIEGLACVKYEGKWGYINSLGNIVIPLRFNEASAFRDGVAEVREYGRLIKIDRLGNEIKQRFDIDFSILS
jgi:serine/threonine protein kinase